MSAQSAVVLLERQPGRPRGAEVRATRHDTTTLKQEMADVNITEHTCTQAKPTQATGNHTHA